MSWASKGKSKSTVPTQKGEGYWVWAGGGKGGKSGTTPGKGQGQVPQSPMLLNQNKQLRTNYDKVKQQLWEAQQALAQTEANTTQVLAKGQQILAKPPQQQDAPTLICPVCACEHHNLQKLRCRNKSCRADLHGSGEVPASKMVKERISRNPLLTNYYQALLTEAGAVECLRSKIAPPPTTGQDTEEKEDPDEPMEESETTAQEDPRTKAQTILDFLEQSHADPEIIKIQKSKIEKLPKPKKPRATQPLLDSGALHNALSQTIEYHDAVTMQAAQTVSRCEAVLKEAQEALELARVQQVEHKETAARQINELRALVNAKLQETKPVLAMPATEAQADQQLLMGELQSWLLKAGMPGHLQGALTHAEIRFGAGPPMSFSIGASPGGEQSKSAKQGPQEPTTTVEHPSAMWEAA